MAQNSNIEWTDHTFNPWIGCTKVSPGCANCYAETLMDKRYGRVKWGKGIPRQRTSAANWKQPLKWNREALEKWRICPSCEWRGAAEEKGHRCGNYKCRYIGKLIQARPRVFCASLADWLDDEVPVEWLADLLKLIHDTPNLDWLLLTKRPENFNSRLINVVKGFSYADPMDIADKISAWVSGERLFANIWIGTTVEDQKRADERIPELLKIPAKVRFLSCEPLLEQVDLKLKFHSEFLIEDVGDDGFQKSLIHWVICGGESGSKARPMQIEWSESIAAQCESAGVAFFMKQGSQSNWPQYKYFESFPKSLQRREFPNA